MTGQAELHALLVEHLRREATGEECRDTLLRLLDLLHTAEIVGRVAGAGRMPSIWVATVRGQLAEYFELTPPDAA